MGGRPRDNTAVFVPCHGGGCSGVRVDELRELQHHLNACRVRCTPDYHDVRQAQAWVYTRIERGVVTFDRGLGRVGSGVFVAAKTQGLGRGAPGYANHIGWGCIKWRASETLHEIAKCTGAGAIATALCSFLGVSAYDDCITPGRAQGHVQDNRHDDRQKQNTGDRGPQTHAAVFNRL